MAAAAFAALILALPASAQDRTVTLIAVGDVGDCGTEGAAKTAKLVDRLPGTIIIAGDVAYPDGRPRDFRDCYDPHWGRHKDRTRPAPGNHEYHSDAVGYFAYWGSRAGRPGEGYYSFEAGAWHVIALNSNIAAGPKSAQARWLRRDLAAATARCVLAFWHHPVFTSAQRGDNPKMRHLYEILYDGDVSVVVNGHEHVYERLAPLDPRGRLDRERGIRAYTAGTGGRRYGKFGRVRPHSEARKSKIWGILKFTLYPDRYRSVFVTVNGYSYDKREYPCIERPHR